MANLTKKEISSELNAWNRILIDFKSMLVNDKIGIYKANDNKIVYIFDIESQSFAFTESDFNIIESLFLNTGDLVIVDSLEFKKILSLKKREIDDIVYDTTDFNIIYTVEKDNEEQETFNIKKIPLDKRDEATTKFISLISNFEELLNNEFKQAHYIRNDGILTTEDNQKYPYKITFSDDINYKLGTKYSQSRYFIRLVYDETFIQVVSKTDFVSVTKSGKTETYNNYKVFNTLFTFNFYKGRV